ncbi:hypothetical protein [Rhodobacter capsulatus]|jgi:hypothetical protein|uniref:hypothetical protein n=1 Tax=Rhodobacter capsulatus TaxID=1061 RepID=UPI0003D2CFC8|nr:hypothetical protein [Rhodobacter capsulatus]ETD00932.1 hypothetical protein U714_14430 [Rhodobacter capsulatus DE442]ETD75228.1 hypothetical protein U717_14590 [Rhodobacter capsulatus R121]ETE52969.1 hypothetical protein U715_14580 [Rhodobacter capsulatus Y262]MDS0928149.1 hypothetical protein [Rhodobacter capsulatus]TQD33462.1 hypothetical protein FKW81_14685 [Rhodobacter capsulatus]
MKSSAAMLVLALLALPAQAEDISPQVKEIVEKELRAWAADPALVAAVIAANEAHAALSQPQIESLDAAWRTELETSTRPTIDPILAAPESQALKAKIEAGGGRFTEAFVTDSHGLNVAQAGPTSDYWQGDEAKFLETFPKGAEAIHVSEVEFDESSQSYSVQASFTVIDPASKAPIGAMTVGLNAEMIQ